MATMPEVGFGVAGIAIALPGVIDLIIQYGQWISDRVNTFRNAGTVWLDLAAFGHRLSQGNLKDLMVIAKQFHNDITADPGLKASLELDIRRLAGDIVAACGVLEKQDTGSIMGRAVFSLMGERRIKELNKNLKSHESELVLRLQVLDMRRNEEAQELFLSDSTFAVHENSGYDIDSTLSVTRVDYSGKDLEESLGETPQNLLHRQLTDKITKKVGYRFGKGILPCLGYRMKPTPQLIFRLPEDSKAPKTLRELLVADHGVASHPLDFRLRLARRLAKAVLRVHIVQLVHKSIRPETILLLKRNVSGTDEDIHYATEFGDVYLTNWRLLRKGDVVSQRIGSAQWVENKYRHPKRQGLQLEERYNLGHDIYSLGVCLLEIGLWDSLVQRAGDVQPRVSNLFRDAAAREDLLSPENNFDAEKVKKTLLRQVGLDRMWTSGIGRRKTKGSGLFPWFSLTSRICPFSITCQESW